MTLVSWALTASAKGVVDPSKTSFSFAYTKRASVIRNVFHDSILSREYEHELENVRDYVGEWRHGCPPRILEIFYMTRPLVLVNLVVRSSAVTVPKTILDLSEIENSRVNCTRKDKSR